MTPGTEDGSEAVVVHERCGFPVVPDEGGNWHHVNPLDDVFCDLLFSGGSMLDALLEGDD